jgi:hypothetical protein
MKLFGSFAPEPTPRRWAARVRCLSEIRHPASVENVVEQHADEQEAGLQIDYAMVRRLCGNWTEFSEPQRRRDFQAEAKARR